MKGLVAVVSSTIEFMTPCLKTEFCGISACDLVSRVLAFRRCYHDGARWSAYPDTTSYWTVKSGPITLIDYSSSDSYTIHNDFHYDLFLFFYCKHSFKRQGCT